MTLLDSDLHHAPSAIVLIPVFNDWEALERLLWSLDETFQDHNIRADILIVDDASLVPAPTDLKFFSFKAIEKVSILELKRNLGHQRAIAIGLAYIAANLNCKAVVVMDGDGEDSPNDVPRLINCCQTQSYTKVIFAKRTKRSETLVFKCFYLVYKLIYKLLTGHHIQVGNFSVIPYRILPRIVVISEIWNHYAAGIMRARIPYTEIATKRSNRLFGRSKMNFVSLVTHGISSISVYADIVGTRLIISISVIVLLILMSLIGIVCVKLFTTLAIPGWTSVTVGILCSILMQAVMLSIVFALMVLNTRNSYGFMLGQDYHYFVSRFKEVFSQEVLSR
jgi:hypothetical protein